ncbi:MAG: alkyl sulfatase dimerization domain-containing protein [Acidimicrobiales bacterium]
MSIRDLAERHWHGECDLADLVHHPVRPALNRASEEVLDGVLVLKSVASVNALDTGDGLVMLDTGGHFDVDHVYDTVRAWRPQGRLAGAVYSHHHADHVFGTLRFDAEASERGWARPQVYGHAAVPQHFDRYRAMNGWNAKINARQFGEVASAMGAAGHERLRAFTWPTEYRYPDVTYHDRLTFRQGSLTFELHHALGETDDATWTWVPERRILHPGDLFIWAVPNAGNPQKVQRYASDWAHSLRQMAALQPEVMLCGHGMPIFGTDRVVRALVDTADLLDSIESQTIALMNTGASLDQVLHAVEIPEHLRDLPYLQPVYDHPQFLVRNVWRRYGGWWDGEPDTLLPAPRAQQAAEWVRLAGGVDVVLARVAELLDGGDARLACHLIEFAALAAPGSSAVHELRARTYRQRASGDPTLMSRALYLHAASSSEAGRRDLVGDW